MKGNWILIGIKVLLTLAFVSAGLAKLFGVQMLVDEFETIGQVAEHHKGTGLGMPIRRKLCEGMGGTLLLESEYGKGSTFWIERPKEKENKKCL